MNHILALIADLRKESSDEKPTDDVESDLEEEIDEEEEVEYTEEHVTKGVAEETEEEAEGTDGEGDAREESGQLSFTLPTGLSL